MVANKERQKITELERRVLELEEEHQYPLTIENMRDLHPVGKNSQGKGGVYDRMGQRS